MKPLSGNCPRSTPRARFHPGASPTLSLKSSQLTCLHVAVGTVWVFSPVTLGCYYYNQTIQYASGYPWIGKICWRRDRQPTPVFWGFPGGSDDKESTCNAGDLGSVPGLGRSLGEGDGYPLQYSGLENSMDRGAWQGSKRVEHNWATFTLTGYPKTSSLAVLFIKYPSFVAKSCPTLLRPQGL